MASRLTTRIDALAAAALAAALGAGCETGTNNRTSTSTSTAPVPSAAAVCSCTSPDPPAPPERFLDVRERNCFPRPLTREVVQETLERSATLDRVAQAEMLSCLVSQYRDLSAGLDSYLDPGWHRAQQVSKDRLEAERMGAAYLLGTMRGADDRSVGRLLERIGIRETRPRGFARHPLSWEDDPAVEALIRIGRPAIHPTIELLATELVDRRRDLAVQVIRHIEDSEIGVLLLQRAARKEKDPARRARLEDAVVRLKKLPWAAD